MLAITFTPIIYQLFFLPPGKEKVGEELPTRCYHSPARPGPARPN